MKTAVRIAFLSLGFLILGGCASQMVSLPQVELAPDQHPKPVR